MPELPCLTLRMNFLNFTILFDNQCIILEAKGICDMPWIGLTCINDVFHFVLCPDLINLKV